MPVRRTSVRSGGRYLYKIIVLFWVDVWVAAADGKETSVGRPQSPARGDSLQRCLERVRGAGTPHVGAPPRPTPDRLQTAFSLARECNLIAG